MKTYFNEFGDVIDDPSYTPPPDAFVYSTRRGDYVFPMAGKLLTVTAEGPDSKEVITHESS